MWVLVVRSAKHGMKEYILSPGKSTIGRADNNKITIKGDLVSRQHCELELDPNTDRLTIRDLGSKNGTYLNRKRINTGILEDGDQIRIGHSVFNLRQRETNPLLGSKKAVIQTTPLTNSLALQSFENHTILLKEIAEQLNIVTDIDIAIETVTSLTNRVLGAERCSIIMAEKFDQLKKMGYPSSITRPVIKEKMIVIIRGAKNETRLGISAILQDVQTALCVPIIVDSQVVAIFYLDRIKASSNPFSEIESELAVGISYQFALCLQRLDMEAKLLHSALHDPITGLPNQVMLTDALSKAVEHTKKQKGYSFAVIAIDIDNFRVINDIYGHDMGDQLLSAVAKRLETSLRQGDFLGRLEGAAFFVLSLDVQEEEETVNFASDLQEVISAPFDLTSPGVILSAGIGISFSNIGYDKPENILRDAKAALNSAKKKGTARLAVFDQKIRDRSVARYQWESRLKHALEKDEIQVNYQPIISLESGTIVGFEALARWKSKTGERFSASEFIQLAEGTQLIFAIDILVMKTACTQLHNWQNKFPHEPPLSISSNLSIRHLSQPRLVEQIEEIIQETGLSPEQLNLELTERTLMEEGEEAISSLVKIRELGVRISLDDFGTGYSSLSMLQTFPMDSIKLDRSFMSGEAWEVAKWVANLGHTLGLSVVAEGVETRQQLDKVRTFECNNAQGFYFSKALDPTGINSLLKENPVW